MQNVNIEQINNEMSLIVDPDLGLTLKDLNALKNISVVGNVIKVEIELFQPIHWAAELIQPLCNEIIKRLSPDYDLELLVSEIKIEIPQRDFLKNVKNIIAVASGKGGVGKSAIASNIAAALSLKGASVGILDGDVYGPSQPTMFGLIGEQIIAQETPDGKTVAYPNEKYGVKVASMGFVMQKEEAAIVRGPMLAGYFSMLFEQIEWGELDFLVFDLPPGTGDIQLTLTQKIPLTGAVIVTTPQEIAVADVRRSISMFNKVDVDILGIVENMSYFIPPDMQDKKYYIFGEGGGKAVAKDNDIDFLGEVPLDIKMRKGNDGGKPIVLSDDSGLQGDILKNITARIVAATRKHNYKAITKPDVEISI